MLGGRESHHIRSVQEEEPENPKDRLTYADDILLHLIRGLSERGRYDTVRPCEQERTQTEGYGAGKKSIHFIITEYHPTNRTCALTSVSLDYNVDGMFTSGTSYINCQEDGRIMVSRRRTEGRAQMMFRSRTHLI